MTTLLVPLQENPLIPNLAEVIASIVFALLLTFLISRFVVPRFEATYAERTATIQGGMEKAEKAQEAAEAAGVSTTSGWQRLAPKRPGFARREV
jgi:F-type H+-transporting ATPase subunit b